jgi:glycosyltransferase involved in cell wall biosynthesis
MFGWEFPPFNSGGLGTACFGLTKALTQQEVDVIFVLPRKIDINSSIKILFADDGVHKRGSRLKLKPVNALLSPYLNNDTYLHELDSFSMHNGEPVVYGRNLLEEVMRYGLAAKHIALEEEFDVIHAHDWLSFPAGIAAKEVSGKPLIVHVHATEFDRTGGNINQVIYEIEKEGMKKADAVITVSGYTKNVVIERYGINPDKIHVVHNGIEVDDYQAPASSELEDSILRLKRAGKKIVLFVGRITLQKGPDYFVKSAAKVLQYEPETIFVVAGSGDMEHQMIQDAANAGISDKIIFAGFLRGEELNQVYRSADLFVMPSVSEPFGLTALESVANGTPVLVSKQSGVSEAMSAALKVDFWDTDEMANKILAVLRYSALQHTLEENGAEEIKKINWKKAASRCIDLYNHVMRVFVPKP